MTLIVLRDPDCWCPVCKPNTYPSEVGYMAVYCPVPKCETRPYANMEELRTHLKNAQAAGDTNHIEIIMLEGWDEVSTGEAVVKAADLEPT